MGSGRWLAVSSLVLLLAMSLSFALVPRIEVRSVCHSAHRAAWCSISRIFCSSTSIPSSPPSEAASPRESKQQQQQHAGPHHRRTRMFTKQRLHEPDRPFTLPPGEFRPKQSLGQNYLSDQNFVKKIIKHFQDQREEVSPADANDKGHRVVEIGPGTGALTRSLFPIYPKMTAVEIDRRAIEFLGKKLPDLSVIHCDVLQFDWVKFAATRGGKISIIGNLPYYTVSQVLFSLADVHHVISHAVLTMQWEVAERLCAKPSTKDYGIPSVIFQLYGVTKMLLKLPPKVFYPAPKVDSALVSIDLTRPHPELNSVFPEQLRKVVSLSFRQRRKMLRQSLKQLLEVDGLVMPDRWATMRPEAISPAQFLQLTRELYQGRLPSDVGHPEATSLQQTSPSEVMDSLREENGAISFVCDQKKGFWRGSLGLQSDSI